MGRQTLWACVLLAAAAGALADPFTWKQCDDVQVPFIPETVTLTPDPPIIGDTAIFKVSGNAVHDVQSGFLDIVVNFMGTEIYTETDDLCGKTTCPIKTGPITVTYVQELPPIAPPGPYDVRVATRDLQGNPLMCVVVSFEMQYPSVKDTIEGAKAMLVRAVQHAKHAASSRRMLAAA